MGDSIQQNADNNNPHATPKPDDAATKMRKALGIHTWGLDLMRLKRRIGEIMQDLESIQDRGAEILAQHNRRLEVLEKAHNAQVQRDESPPPQPVHPHAPHTLDLTHE